MLKGMVKSDRQLICPLPVQNNSRMFSSDGPSQWSMDVTGFTSNVSISANCIDYTATGLTVQRVYQPSIIHVSPTVGSSRGGARVLLTGRNHHHQYHHYLHLLILFRDILLLLHTLLHTIAHRHHLAVVRRLWYWSK